MLEQPACLLQILAPVLQDQCTKLILGRESGITELHNVSIIALRYQAEPHRVLALLGPSRMHYAHLIPLVEEVGLQLSKHLNQP